MTLNERYRKIQEIPLISWIALGFVIISWLLWISNTTTVPESARNFHLIGGGAIVLHMILTREKKLLTIDEAEDIAFRDSKRRMNQGKIKEQGKLIPLEDGKLFEFQDKPKSIIVGIGLEGSSPKVLLYSIEPYSGYIQERGKIEHWNVSKKPNLQVVFTSYIEDMLQSGKVNITKEIGENQ